jgi:ribulose-phosphate 3-epimerase
VEGVIHLHRTLVAIAKLGKRGGVALSPATPVPATPVAAPDEVLPELDRVVVMTVDPGFGGQHFIAATVPKIQRIRAVLDRVGVACELEVDGGIHAETAPLAVETGARVLVAGSAISEDPAGVRTGMARLPASVAGAA